MVTLRLSKENELQLFVDMEHQAHANRFVNCADLLSHQSHFNDARVIYLSILNNKQNVSGYFILKIEADNNSVEFNRIVIDENSRGIGQIAITAMEEYCCSVLNTKRIWLDVYEDNFVGRHIYEKLGYDRFKEGLNNGRKLLFYQKYFKYN